MSEMVHYKGTLKKVEFNEQMGFMSLEEKCRKLLRDNGINECEELYDSWAECLRDNLYNKYIIYHDDIFKVVSRQDATDDDVFIINKDKDGSYRYEVEYYNGCTGFEEAIGHAFDNVR